MSTEPWSNLVVSTIADFEVYILLLNAYSEKLIDFVLQLELNFIRNHTSLLVDDCTQDAEPNGK